LDPDLDSAVAAGRLLAIAEARVVVAVVVAVVAGLAGLNDAVAAGGAQAFISASVVVDVVTVVALLDHAAVDGVAQDETVAAAVPGAVSLAGGVVGVAGAIVANVLGR